MNNLSSHVLVLALGLAIGLFGYTYLKPESVSSPTPEPVFQGAAGPDQSSHVNFMDNVTVGGQRFATSSIGAVTYTAASIANSKLIEHIAASAVTATLPTNAALSGVGFLPREGDTQTLFIHASTSAITLAGNTDVILGAASTSLKIDPGYTGRLDFTRLGATEARRIQVLLTTY